MFDKIRHKELCAEIYNTDWDYRINEICSELLLIITIDDLAFNEFIEYMKSDMTGEEYVYLSEISDEIAQKKQSKEFVNAYKNLANKFPIETKDYHIQSFIEVAEAWTE